MLTPLAEYTIPANAAGLVVLVTGLVLVGLWVAYLYR